MSKCKYLSDTGICKVTSDGEVSEPCIMGPCGKEEFEQPRFTPEEIEAMDFLCRYNSYERSDDEKVLRHMRLTDSIAIVRSMLQEVTGHD